MYAKIVDNIIVSYSKTKMEGGIFTETKGLSGGITIGMVTSVGFSQENNEDIFDIEIIETQEELDKIKEKEIDRINIEFNEKIIDFNKEYPEEIRNRFTDKLIKAEKVIAGGEDYYLTTMGNAKGISALEYASIIKHKAIIFETFLLDAEIERDLQISKL